MDPPSPLDPADWALHTEYISIPENAGLPVVGIATLAAQLR